MVKLIYIFLIFTISFVFASNLKECENIIEAKAYINLKVPCPYHLASTCTLLKKDNKALEQCLLTVDEKELSVIYKKTIEKIKSDEQNKMFMIMADDLEKKK